MNLSNPEVPNASVNIQPLVNLLSNFFPLEKSVLNFLRKNITLVSFKSGDLILKAGEHCNSVYFIKSGVVRGFVNEGKKEITTWISSENELVSSITSFGIDEPAVENLQSLEACDLLLISNTAMNQLYEEFPEFNIIGRKLLEHYYRDAEKRALIVRLSNAETKYRFFLEHYPHLSNRVQLQYIASFLAITMETLSRVRRKIRFYSK